MTHKSSEMTAHVTTDATIDVTDENCSDLDRQVALVQAEIQAGRVKCSVKSIREYLGCAQARAREVRKLIDLKLIGQQVALPTPS
jgi:K+-transporting ATPase c subunit